MDVSIIGDEEWDMISEIEGACAPPLIKNESQVFVQHSESDGGILITEPENAGTFVIERATHDHGEIHRPEDKIEVNKNVKRMVIEV